MKSAQPSLEIISARSLVAECLSYNFIDLELFVEALTHRSFARSEDGRKQGSKWNERLEFLGDAVLSLVLSHHLFTLSDNFSEGELSKIRAALVNETQLASVARRLKLGAILLTGGGELTPGGCDKNSILADALEAIFGAIYLDGGLEAASRAILKAFAPLLQLPLSTYLETDYKTTLQEWTQEHFKDIPTYRVIASTGPAHIPRFEVAVSFRDQELAVGSGPSKKLAAQHAARQALTLLQNSEPTSQGS